MPWFLPALAIGVGAVAAKKAWDHFHARSAFDRAQQCTSRDAPEGALVRIEGRAQALGPPLKAPLSATTSPGSPAGATRPKRRPPVIATVGES